MKHKIINQVKKDNIFTYNDGTMGSNEQGDKVLDKMQGYYGLQSKFIRILESISLTTKHADPLDNDAALEITAIKALLSLPAVMVLKVINATNIGAGVEKETTDEICALIESSKEIVTIPVAKYEKARQKLVTSSGQIKKAKEIKKGLFLVETVRQGIKQMHLMNSEGKVFASVMSPRSISRIKKSIATVKLRNEDLAEEARLETLRNLRTNDK